MKARASILFSILIIFAFAAGCATTETKSQSSAPPVVQAQKTVRPSKAEIEASVVKELEDLGKKSWLKRKKRRQKRNKKAK